VAVSGQSELLAVLQTFTSWSVKKFRGKEVKRRQTRVVIYKAFKVIKQETEWGPFLLNQVQYRLA